MRRINLNTEKTHFIGCWSLENNDLCNKITNFFKDNKNLQKQGITASGKDLKTKSRIDITVSPNDLKNPKFDILKKYINELHKCFLDYQNQWPFLKSMLKTVYVPSFNIQKYLPGDHFADSGPPAVDPVGFDPALLFPAPQCGFLAGLSMTDFAGPIVLWSRRARCCCVPFRPHRNSSGNLLLARFAEVL